MADIEQKPVLCPSIDLMDVTSWADWILELLPVTIQEAAMPLFTVITFHVLYLFTMLQ